MTIKAFQMVQRVLIGIGALSLLFLAIGAVVAVTRPPPQPPSTARQAQILQAEIILRSIRLFELNNSGKRPLELTELIPSYLGTNLIVTNFRYSPRQEPLLQERNVGPEGLRIMGKEEGSVYLLKPGE